MGQAALEAQPGQPNEHEETTLRRWANAELQDEVSSLRRELEDCRERLKVSVKHMGLNLETAVEQRDRAEAAESANQELRELVNYHQRMRGEYQAKIAALESANKELLAWKADAQKVLIESGMAKSRAEEHAKESQLGAELATRSWLADQTDLLCNAEKRMEALESENVALRAELAVWRAKYTQFEMVSRFVGGGQAAEALAGEAPKE